MANPNQMIPLIVSVADNLVFRDFKRLFAWLCLAAAATVLELSRVLQGQDNPVGSFSGAAFLAVFLFLFDRGSYQKIAETTSQLLEQQSWRMLELNTFVQHQMGEILTVLSDIDRRTPGRRRRGNS